jgi:hypothetical protein
MLVYKREWRRVANSLPTGSVLIVRPTRGTPQHHVVERIAAALEAAGHQVKTIAVNQLVPSLSTPTQLVLLD